MLCVVTAGLFFAIECTAYWYLVGDPLARLKISVVNSHVPTGFDPDLNLGGVRFFTWPIENLIFGKAFSFDLLLLLITALIVWRRLSKTQQILCTFVFASWAWMGFGSQVPWAYKPLARQMHLYIPLTFGIAALLPATVSAACTMRPKLAKGLLGIVLFMHFMNLSVGGRWGQDVDVSKAFLRYAEAHPQQNFITDVRTMNHMYILSGFRLPKNVVCLNGKAVQEHLLANDEPPAMPRVKFPPTRLDAALVNSEAFDAYRPDPDFRAFLRQQMMPAVPLVPPQYKLIFRPFVAFKKPLGVMVQTLGGTLVPLPNQMVNQH
jgi:hypothetical protein